ncbi:hypothetical protein BC629DRAFT_620778 [Irpex lacteus]|nr:hypothetical protein BC629DRAFT_620778 [Irpex lacteus]
MPPYSPFPALGLTLHIIACDTSPHISSFLTRYPHNTMSILSSTQLLSKACLPATSHPTRYPTSKPLLPAKPPRHSCGFITLDIRSATAVSIYPRCTYPLPPESFISLLLLSSIVFAIVLSSVACAFIYRLSFIHCFYFPIHCFYFPSIASTSPSIASTSPSIAFDFIYCCRSNFIPKEVHVHIPVRNASTAAYGTLSVTGVAY